MVTAAIERYPEGRKEQGNRAVREKLSLATARRIALAAQGLAEPRPAGDIAPRHLKKVLGRTGLLQIDSVSAVVRAHYMPLFSRLGPYRRNLLDDAATGRSRRVFEYWAHEASFLPVETWPLVQWRMAKAARNEGIYGGLARWASTRTEFIDEIFREIETAGPLAASDFDGHKGSGGWWGWSEAKHALEWLFWAGRITTATRRGFERVYDLPARVLPRDVLALPVPDQQEAVRELLRISARALGIATAADLRDYFRLSPGDADGPLADLVATGELHPVRVEGWSQKVFAWPDAKSPRKVEACALLAPFDPLVWERGRAERLFDFRYRLEIYTPAEKRVHGYYVLPFVLGERIVARVDLKADRAAKVLRVHGAFSEGCAPDETAERLAAELRLLTGWLDLADIEVARNGDLSAQLAAEVARF